MAGSLIRDLTSMKFAMLRNSPRGMRMLGWVLGALAVLGTWALVVLADDAVRAEVAMLALVVWLVGAALGPVTMSGAGVLRPEYFALLPIERRRLALALLATTFPGVASGYVLLACLVIVVPASDSTSPISAVIVAVLGAVLTWVVTLTLSRVVYGLLGAAMRTRLGVEIAAIQFGLMIGALMAGWIAVMAAIQSLPVLLREGVGTAAADMLAWVPSSWALTAALAVPGRPAAVAIWLGALLVLAALLLGAATALLRTDVGGGSAQRRRRPWGSRVLDGRAILPSTSIGAVLGKELRQWWRDPWRSLELRSSIWTGVTIGVFALTAPWMRDYASVAGLVVAFMVALGGVNLYGQDGTAIWLTVVGQREDTVRSDVRGRQLATILLFAVPAVVVSTVFASIVGSFATLPIVAAMLPALFGVASGVSVLMSAVGVSPGVDPRRRVGPNDAGGDLGLQVQVAMWSTGLLVAPTIAAIVGSVAGVIGTTPGTVPWWVIPIGIANGVLGFWGLGRLATVYLRDRLPTVFSQIRYRRNDDEGGGALVAFAHASQKAEDAAREAKEKERRRKVGASNVAE